MTKISSLHIRPFDLPFRVPFQTSRERLYSRRGWVVWVVDEQGGWGVGEAAPLSSFGMENLMETGRVLADWARVLPGREVQLEAPVTPELAAAFGLAGKFPGGTDGAATPAARHGVELALLDLAARRAGVPLARFLNPAAAGSVEVNAVLGEGSIEQTVRRAEALAGEGYRTLKLKVGAAPPEEDTARVRAVRESVGGEVRLRLDANEGWNEQAAPALLESLAPLDIEYVEQPLPAADIAGMARLAAGSPIPLAADEAVVSRAGARAILERRAANVLILKPMPLGGPLAALATARLAAEHGVPVVVTTTLDGSVARAGAVAAAGAVAGMAALPADGAGAGMAHGLATGGLLESDLAPGAPFPNEGRMILSTEPGLGVSLPPPKGTSTEKKRRLRPSR